MKPTGIFHPQKGKKNESCVFRISCICHYVLGFAIKVQKYSFRVPSRVVVVVVSISGNRQKMIE